MRAIGGLAVVVALVAVGAAGGFYLGRGADTTTTITQIDQRAVGLPAPVEATRTALLAAAQAGDYEALRPLLPADGFSYTFGGPAEGGPIAYWQELERTTDERPLETLAILLQLPYALDTGYYSWPFAHSLTWDRLTAHERQLLAPLVREGRLSQLFPGSEGYYGWRTGIEPDGTWRFFIAGD